MKLGTIVNCQPVIEKLRGAQLPAEKVFRMRKSLKALTGEIEQWNELRDEYIKKNGEEEKDGNVVIKPGSKAYKGFIEYANKVLAEEVEVTVSPLSEEDLTGLELSVRELDQMEALGLLEDTAEEKVV